MNIFYFIQNKLADIARRYFIILLAATLVAAFSTFFITTQKGTTYEARARLLIGPKTDSHQTDYDALRIGGGLVQTYAELAKTHPILQNASEQLNLDLNAAQMDSIVEVRSNNDTRIISIIAQYHDPDGAVGIANALSESLSKLSPPNVDGAQPIPDQLQVDIGTMQKTITDTQIYIETLETELQLVQDKTQIISIEEIALINQFLDIEDELSLERSRLSNTLRTQGSNFGTLNDKSNISSNTSDLDLSNMKEQVVSHVELTEKLIQDSEFKIKELEGELEKLGSDFDFSAYYLATNAIERKNEIEGILSQERARLGDQTRTLALVVETYYTVGSNPNQITIIEPADTAQEIDNLLGIKVISSAIAGLIAALSIIILIETLKASNAASSDEKGKRE